MIIVLKPQATEQDAKALLNQIEQCGLKTTLYARR